MGLSLQSGPCMYAVAAHQICPPWPGPFVAAMLTAAGCTPEVLPQISAALPSLDCALCPMHRQGLNDCCCRALHAVCAEILDSVFGSMLRDKALLPHLGAMLQRILFDLLKALEQLGEGQGQGAGGGTLLRQGTHWALGGQQPHADPAQVSPCVVHGYCRLAMKFRCAQKSCAAV